jgi:hypothetical protein
MRRQSGLISCFYYKNGDCECSFNLERQPSMSSEYLSPTKGFWRNWFQPVQAVPPANEAEPPLFVTIEVKDPADYHGREGHFLRYGAGLDAACRAYAGEEYLSTYPDPGSVRDLGDTLQVDCMRNVFEE